MDRDARLAILAHELRHLDQHARGFCPATDDGAAAVATFTFAVETDTHAIATWVAWSLAAEGEPGP
jgi:hypothetical protein